MSTAEQYELNKNLAQMLKGGVIMDVTTPEQAKIAEEAGACAVSFLPKSQDFDWKRRESAAIEGQSTTDTTYSGRLSKRCPTTTRRRNGQGRAAKRFVHFDRDEKPPRHPFWCRGGPEGTGDLPP